jgi:hypothetical protein
VNVLAGTDIFERFARLEGGETDGLKRGAGAAADGRAEAAPREGEEGNDEDAQLQEDDDEEFQEGDDYLVVSHICNQLSTRHPCSLGHCIGTPMAYLALLYWAKCAGVCVCL